MSVRTKNLMEDGVGNALVLVFISDFTFDVIVRINLE